MRERKKKLAVAKNVIFSYRGAVIRFSALRGLRVPKLRRLASFLYSTIKRENRIDTRDKTCREKRSLERAIPFNGRHESITRQIKST